MAVETNELFAQALVSPYPQFVYWVALFICWSLLCLQLLRYGLTADKTDIRFDFVPILLGLALTAGRWPTLLLNEPLNSDESELLAGALRFMHDPVPWRGADLTTSGPLNSYILLIPRAVGLEPSYGSARAVGLGLLIITVICWYLSIKQVRDKFVAISVLLSPITFLCFVQNPDFIHYNSELVAVGLLSLGALTVSSLSNFPSTRLFIAALFLGAVPFAKLQATPLALVAFCGIFIFTWRMKGERFAKTAIAMAAGGLIVPLTIAAILIATGSFDDAWRSYILSGMQISAKPMSLYSFARYVFGNIGFACSIGLLVVITFMGSNRQFVRRQMSGAGGWLVAGSVVYGLSTLYVIYRPGNPWGHYLFFALPAAVFLATTIFAPWHIGSPWAQLTSRIRSRGTAWVMGAALGLLVFGLHGPFWVLERVAAPRDDPVARIIRALVKDDRDFAVWGWMPEYYVMTGKQPPTRDIINQFQIWDGPQRDYYRERYLTDFNKSWPNVFVDATGPGNFTFRSLVTPVENFPQLYEIIRSNYVLLLDLKYCGTPHTRIFVSQTRLLELGHERVQAIAKQPACLQDSSELDRLISLLG
jgi:hypothetical protein